MNDSDGPSATSAHTPLTDSPWLWLALFSATSLVALVVINHKHTLRQARLEQRYANRVQARAERNTRQPLELPVSESPQQIEAEYREQPVGTPMVAARPQSSLVPLMIASGIVLTVALAGLWRQQLREG